MGKWIDTHAHLFHQDFETDLSEVLTRSQKAGVDTIYLPNLNTHSLAAMYRVEKSQSPRCYACLGLHPCYVDQSFESELLQLEKELQTRTFAAIGETGLDTYHTTEHLPLQKEAFLRHLQWAKQYDLPLLLHARGTTGLLIDYLAKDPPPRGGVFHCFSGTYEEALAVIELGFFIGIGGVLTYKSGQSLREIVKQLPLDVLLLESDAPYLSPTGAERRRNEPAFIPLIGKALAKCIGVSTEEIAATTSYNAGRLFLSTCLPQKPLMKNPEA